MFATLSMLHLLQLPALSNFVQSATGSPLSDSQTRVYSRDGKPRYPGAEIPRVPQSVEALQRHPVCPGVPRCRFAFLFGEASRE